MAELPYSVNPFWQNLDGVNPAAPDRYFSVNCTLYKIRNYDIVSAKKGDWKTDASDWNLLQPIIDPSYCIL